MCAQTEDLSSSLYGRLVCHCISPILIIRLFISKLSLEMIALKIILYRFHKISSLSPLFEILCMIKPKLFLVLGRELAKKGENRPYKIRHFARMIIHLCPACNRKVNPTVDNHCKYSLAPSIKWNKMTT